MSSKGFPTSQMLLSLELWHWVCKGKLIRLLNKWPDSILSIQCFSNSTDLMDFKDTRLREPWHFPLCFQRVTEARHCAGELEALKGSLKKSLYKYVTKTQVLKETRGVGNVLTMGHHLPMTVWSITKRNDTYTNNGRAEWQGPKPFGF